MPVIDPRDEIARLTAELAALQSTHEALCEAFDKAADGLAASQERERVLREAVDNMPHEWGCAIFYSAGVKCSCWKRGALGEP